ncbi:hypothetical protein JOL79_10870 [Microbispora sp. RL4-1S]|uniref:Uncharacterized protein n=1 Tax=Microbispora oryzae TaxID=2806554 RepID=A0A940WET9_9ACTN|nr:hypothetical protein [Microbispora oryzae]MBP2704314.1 hypothetical protein [Microbispora oryzae]
MIDQQLPAHDAANPAPPVETDESDAGSGSVVALLERIASIVLPIGVALYAVLYLGVEQMYATFGISPQQAGIDQSVLFGRLMGTLVLVLLFGIPALGFIVGLGWLINKVTGGTAGRAVQAIRRRPWVAALIAALWCGATYWGFFRFFGDVGFSVMVVVAVGLGVLTFLVPFRLLRRKPVGRAGMKVLVGGLTGLGLGFVLILQMSEGAADLADTGHASLLLDTVGFQDQWAVLKNGDDDKPLYDGRWMMLLGETDSTYVFYDCDKQETFRRGMDGTILSQIQLDPEREKGFTCGSMAEQE